MLSHQGSKILLHAGKHEVALDCANKEADVAFFSHAHSDHACSAGKASTALATRATLDLIEARGQCLPLQASDSVSFDDLKLEMENSGHVLGSAQLFAQWDGTSFAYTGDFKLSDSLTCKAARPLQAENILMEATYGSSEYVFPAREEVHDSIAKWTKSHFHKGEIAVLGGYSLGKAQEIVKLLNEHAGIAPIVNENIARLCAVYRKHGVKLDFVPSKSSEGEQALARGKKFVAVLSHHEVTPELAFRLRELHGRRVACSLATGWALRGGRFENDYFKSFCLSDHADFNELVRYAEQSEAKNIFTTHGFAEELAGELRKRGMNARPLEKKSAKRASKSAVQEKLCC